MMIGKWSDDKSCVVLQEERRARSGEAQEMSGEVWLVLVLNGFRVGESALFRMLRWGSWFSMASSRTSEYCVVSQAVLSALKSSRVYGPRVCLLYVMIMSAVLMSEKLSLLKSISSVSMLFVNALQSALLYS